MTEITPYVLQQAPPPAAKTSKDTTRRLASGRALRAALRIQGPDVARRSQARLREHLRDGDPEPDVGASVVGYGRQLEAAEAALAEKEAGLYKLQAELAARIQERRERQSRLRAQMVGLRFTVVGQYEAPDVIALGLEKHTARSVDALVRQAERTGKNLLADGVETWLGASLFPQATFDAAVHGRHLTAAAEGMSALLRRIDETRRRLDAALLAKREALAAFDEVYLRTARMFEELCRHAGETKLAGRVRPTERKRRRDAGKTDDEDDGSGMELHATVTNASEPQEETTWPRSHEPSRPLEGRTVRETPREAPGGEAAGGHEEAPPSTSGAGWLSWFAGPRRTRS